MEKTKYRKAIFLSPLAAPVVYLALLIIIIPLAPEGVMTNIVGLVFYGAHALPMGYVGSILILLPVVSLMKSTNNLNAISLSISGFITGGILFSVLVSLITHYYLSDMITSPHLAWYLISGGAMGVGVAYTFSVISGITKPSSGRSR